MLWATRGGKQYKTPSSSIQETGTRRTEPCAAEKTAAGGLLADPYGKSNRRTTSQEVIVMKGDTNSELPEKVSTEDITVALYTKKE